MSQYTRISWKEVCMRKSQSLLQEQMKVPERVSIQSNNLLTNKLLIAGFVGFGLS